MNNSLGTFLGKKGSGKSTLVAECLEEHSRPIVLDINAEEKYARPGTRVVWGFEECLEALESVEGEDEYSLALRCVDDEAHDAIADYLDLMRVCYELPGSLIVLEECNNYCSSASLPWELARLVRQGRHRRIDLYFVARRPSELHRDLTANSDFVVTFRQEEPRDVLYLRERMGPELADAARMLPDHELLVDHPERAPTAVLRRIAMQGGQAGTYRPHGGELDDASLEEASAELDEAGELSDLTPDGGGDSV